MNLIWFRFSCSLNVALLSITFIFHVTAYHHGESSDSSGVESWILLVLPVHQSILGDEPIGPTWFPPCQMDWVGPCQSRGRVRRSLNTLGLAATPVCLTIGGLTGGRGSGRSHIFWTGRQGLSWNPPAVNWAFGVVSADSVLVVAKGLQGGACVEKLKWPTGPDEDQQLFHCSNWSPEGKTAEHGVHLNSKYVFKWLYFSVRYLTFEISSFSSHLLSFIRRNERKYMPSKTFAVSCFIVETSCGCGVKIKDGTSHFNIACKSRADASNLLSWQALCPRLL